MSEEPRPVRPRVFVTLGDGLAAGFGPWKQSTAGRRTSVAARIARRLGVPFGLPPSESAEILRVVSEGRLTEDREPTAPHHLAVPGLDFAGLFDRRPSTPLLRAHDEKSTAINLALGLPNLLYPNSRPPSLLEAAASHRPTHVLVGFGYDAAVQGLRTGDFSGLCAQRITADGLDRIHRTLDGARLALLAAPDPSLSPALRSLGPNPELSARLADYNGALRRWAGECGAVFIDSQRALEGVGPLYFGADGVYPNAAGHHRLAVVALEELTEAWALAGPIESLAPVPPVEKPARSTGRAPHSAWATMPDSASGLVLKKGRACDPDQVLEERELTLELDGGASFCQLALVDEVSGSEITGRRPTLEKVFGGPPIGLAPLSGVVELSLGKRDKSGERPIRLGVPVALSAAAESVLTAPELLRIALDDFEVKPLLSFEARQGRGDKSIDVVSGGVKVRSAFLDSLSAPGSALPEPEIEFELELPPRGDAFHVDLRLRANWILPASTALPVGDMCEIEGPERGASKAGTSRLVTVGPTRLLLYMRLTTLAERRGQPARAPRKRRARLTTPEPVLAVTTNGHDGQDRTVGPVELPTLAVLQGEYDLQAPELGGAARDERRLLGLTRLDLGESVGQLQPLIVTLASPSVGRNANELIGFDGEVRFPNRLWRRRLPSWRQEVPSLAVAHRDTGRLLGGLVLTAHSNGLPADVTCRMPAAGRLSHEGGQLRFDLTGAARVELPAGTSFKLSGAEGELVDPSRVDFDLSLEATGNMEAPRGTISGEERLVSTNRQLFSFRYVLPPGVGERTLFEYQNHSQGGVFQLTCPLRLLFARSPGSRPGRVPDTVILEGLGTWRGPAGGVELSHRHVIFVSRRSRESPYVAILIDGGATSNVEAGAT